MVLCFEEKDRQLIEAEYGTIIEFKRKLYKSIMYSREVIKAICECWDGVKEKLLEAVKQFVEAITPMFYDLIERCRSLFDDLVDGKLDLYIEPRERYRIVKNASKCGCYDLQTYEKKIRVSNTIQHHCRNNC